MTLYLDLDGVLADFDAHYHASFGIRADKITDNVDWSLVRSVPGFYRNLPMMRDAALLWDFAKPFRPTILTGCPKSIPGVGQEKRDWVAHWLGADVPVITCASRDKAQHCTPGDILVDDWVRYQRLWIAAGGTWITHTSAEQSISELKACLETAT